MSDAYKEGYFELQRGDVILAAKKFNEAELLFPQSPMGSKISNYGSLCILFSRLLQ